MSFEPGKIADVLPLVKQKRVAVQAGGCCGVFPKLLAQHFDYVYTFEPDLENFEALCRNVPEHNVFKFPAALGVNHEGVSIVVPERTNTNVGALTTTAIGPIPTLVIDDLALQQCDLIYLDVEGAEENALVGAAFTIERYSPVIVYEQKDLGPDPFHLIEDLGYRKHTKLGNDQVCLFA